MEINQKSKRKSITKSEYYQLLNYRNLNSMIIEFLEGIEYSALDITQEINPKDKYENYLLGGLTSDLLNCRNEDGVKDCLKLLGIIVEDEKFEKKNMKDIGKVVKKKSGSKGKKKGVVEYEDRFEESDEMKKYLEDHKIVVNDVVSDNILLFVNDKKFEAMINASDTIVNSMVDLSKFGVIYDDEKAVG